MSNPNTERDIKTISFGRACRERLGMYLSSDQTEALHLGLREIYVNSLDALTETNAPKGVITIEINSKIHRITVTDDGPGIPNKKREDGDYSLVAAYTLSHTGSHFDGRAVNSIGTNGVGGSIVNHTASEFAVTSNDGKKSATALFVGSEDGAQLVKYKESAAEGHTGVKVSYVPDFKVYGDAWFVESDLIAELDEMMKFYPKYKITLNFDGHKTNIAHPSGLKEVNTRVYYESDNLIIALGIGDGGIKPYGNRLYLPNGGAFFTHFKTQFTRIINDLSGLKLTGNQAQAVFNGYIAIFVSNPLFSNQSKTAISNKEVNVEITVALKNEMEKFSKTKDWEKVIKGLEMEMKAEEAAERARARIKAAMDKINKPKRTLQIAEKLKDCIATGEEAWLAITEGNSAQGALNKGRDNNIVATYPIRGKFINCLKNKQEDYLDNQELQEIAQILGGGLFDKYNAKKLKYGKVLIAVDADADGKNIADLLITFFYVCMPEFIKEGRLYWMRAPLYYRESTHEYIFTEEQWNKVKKKEGFVRAKGLGEMNVGAIEESLFGKFKVWEQLKPGNWNAFSKLVNDLMGTDVETRRDYLFDKVDFDQVTFL